MQTILNSQLPSISTNKQKKTIKIQNEFRNKYFSIKVNYYSCYKE